jgi:hypothetical protein
MQSVECPPRRRLRRNVGLYGRKVRPRFGHLKQQPALLLVRSLGGSSGTIERLSPITHNVCHWILGFQTTPSFREINALMASRFHQVATGKVLAAGTPPPV